MAFENSAGLNVSNHYGPRTSGQTVGRVKTEGRKTELKLNITAADIIAGGPALGSVVIPAGARILEVYSETITAFTTGNADNILEIGTDTSEVTNGVSLLAASILNVGNESQTANLAGTWDAELALAAATTVGYAMSGTTAGVTAGAGEVNVTIVYI